MHPLPYGSAADQVPLIVDVDGTLLHDDLFRVGVAWVLRHRPHHLVSALIRLPWGRAHVKAFVAAVAEVRVEGLPRTVAVEELLAEARHSRQPIVLASGAHGRYVAHLAGMVGAEDYLASDSVTNLTGPRKLAAICDRYSAFDYVGNSAVDIPLWRVARRAFGVNLPNGLRGRLARLRPDFIFLDRGKVPPASDPGEGVPAPHDPSDPITGRPPARPRSGEGSARFPTAPPPPLTSR